MAHLYIRRNNKTGAINIAMLAEVNSEGEFDAIEDYEGPFEVPDDFGYGEHEMSYYRLKNGELVIDEDAKAAHRAEMLRWEKEEQQNVHKQCATEHLQKIQAKSAAQSATNTDDVIALAPLLAEWEAKAYAVGDIVQYEDAPYRCVQAHNAAGNPGWNPNSAASLWAKYHARSAEYALPWSQPTGAHDAYQKDEYMVYGEAVYRCKTNNTVHAPDILPAAWEKR